MINFIKEINRFYNNSIYCGDTDSVYGKNYWDVLGKAKLFCKKLSQGKNDYETGGIFHNLFLAPKINYCLTINDFGIIQQHMTFKGVNDSK